jgi:hypothetical protein
MLRKPYSENRMPNFRDAYQEATRVSLHICLAICEDLPELDEGHQLQHLRSQV